jgi:hypothetical protein
MKSNVKYPPYRSMLTSGKDGGGGMYGGYIPPPQGPPNLRPKLPRGVWQFFHVVKNFFRGTGDLFLFARRRRNFWELGRYILPPAGGRNPPRNGKNVPMSGTNGPLP